MLCISAEMTSNSTLTLFTDERRLSLVLSIAASHAAQCFLQKTKLRPNNGIIAQLSKCMQVVR